MRNDPSILSRFDSLFESHFKLAIFENASNVAEYDSLELLNGLISNIV